MNKKQKEVEAAKLAAERKELEYLKSIYEKAASDVAKKIAIQNGTINVLLQNYDDLSEEEKSILQSKIYQKKFQKNIQQQLDGFLADLESGQYKSIEDYLNGCYETGFIGTMYDIQGQGIPVVTPIDQKNVVKAIQLDSKISKPLYTKLGENVDELKMKIRASISRGIATSSHYRDIARNIASNSKVGFNKAMRIARTEGHRIQTSAAMDAQFEAKKAGADVVKQWDAALDGRTRSTHRQLDGQIRELDEQFEANGMKTDAPGHFGNPAEDVNCRCALLQRARWALGEDELEILKQRAAYFGLDKTDDFEEYKKKYLKATNNGADSGSVREGAQKIKANNALANIVNSDRIWTGSIDEEISKDGIPVCNPNYSIGGSYRTNCGNCSVTYEMRRRGLDVEANPSRSMYVSDWEKLFVNADVQQFTPLMRPSKRGKTDEEWIAELRAMPSVSQQLSNQLLELHEEGARGSVYVKWQGKGGSGHYFSWEIEGGEVRFVDPQSGKVDASEHFAKARADSILTIRWDNLEPTEVVSECYKNKG